MRRVLSVHSGGPIMRGSELALLDLLVSLQSSSVVKLLCDRPSMAEKARSMGIDTELIPQGEFMLDRGDIKLKLWALIRSNWRTLREIRKFRPTVLYANGGRALQMAYLAGRLSRTPLAVHLHAPYNRRYLYLYGITRADLVIHCSKIVRDAHEAKVGFRKSVAMPNAVDESRFPSVEELARPASRIPLIGFIGSVCHRKGIDILIQAFKLLQDRGINCGLRIGGTEETDAYRKQAEEARVRVEFVGEVKREKLAEFFADIDLHVLPTRQDAMPLSIIEAAYCGVPTVAHNVGGVSESMMQGRLGILYENNTPERLAEAITQGLADWRSASRSREIAQRSRREFSLVANVERLGALFDSLHA